MTIHQTPPRSKGIQQAGSQWVNLCVVKGALVPATEADVDTLRRFRLRVGHTVRAEIDRPRCAEGLRILHSFAQLVSQNIEGYEHLTAHQVLKRLQAESGVGCEIVSISIQDFWNTLQPGLRAHLETLDSQIVQDEDDRLVTGYKPKSLSQSVMDDTEFQEIFDGLCRYVALKYWPGMSPDAIAETARLMPHSIP